ncbi:polysaccharide deacetylase family protein [Aspergillus homomorphus CBS 101889]|uniref:Glycoside hydrolase/deacetylase n=1 Tax=Aspergillus homomorphus (strain CBS 101889) TaxID=1450537 RepID=A0A395HXR5_ASPHC|nr:glycoside hydrolase/deacetylase [Aspergillus homomorphus CBS 101889]RAL12183.1 glycoside hydrolase/deacetylase [Aspergillus homomorphus CBS 101889]
MLLLLTWHILITSVQATPPPPPPPPSPNLTDILHNPEASPNTLLIDTFLHQDVNDLGHWHGPLEGLTVHHSPGFVRFFPSDPDHNYHTQLSASSCFDLRPYQPTHFLHIVFSGTTKFSIFLNQNNPACNFTRNPFPQTSDVVEAARYARGNDIYIPLAHFQIDQTRAVSVSFGGFYSLEPLTLYRIEIVPSIPVGFPVPHRMNNGRLVLTCSRPGSFAFGIDDGQPRFAQEVMKILEEERVLVTFFVVGLGLRDRDTNFSNVYREMIKRGHQIALHSDTHRKMEGLASTADIDREIVENIKSFRQILGIETHYFRPPFGTLGARTRQRLANFITDPQVITWSVDIEDWLWADSKTPEKQREAFFRDVMHGGNLAVMHFLSPTTVGYFREVIQFVKGQNKSIMRIDQCLGDPRSPPLKYPVH